MIKSKLRANNPLTVIAIFSMLTEASAAVSLPYIDRENQKIYIWFLIIFPSILMTLFFLTLNFNNKSLYSPKDYPKEKTQEPLHLRSENEERSNKPIKTCVPTQPYASLLSKSGIRFISYTPDNFIFLPQGHRHYGPKSKREIKKPSDPALNKYQLSEDGEEASRLHLIDFSHPSLRLTHDHTMGDLLQVYYKMLHPKKGRLDKKDVLLLLVNSSLKAQWCSTQRLKLSPCITSHLGEATIIAYNTETHQLNALN